MDDSTKSQKFKSKFVDPYKRIIDIVRKNYDYDDEDYEEYKGKDNKTETMTGIEVNLDVK